MPVADRRKLANEIIAEIAPFMDDFGMAYPAEVHTLTAQKAK